MSLTFGAAKQQVRDVIFVTGEAPNLTKSHDKMFVDAMIDLQQVVECLQQNNTSILDQCSTLYNCGLTVLDAPRGAIKKVSIVDRFNATTGKEDATADIDWCSEVPYNQVDPCHIKAYLSRSRKCGSCLNVGSFFGLGRPYPTPTDAGLPSGLAALPLGFHYPQTSTDRAYGRAGRGIWAIERGNIFIGPWIQSTESVVIMWDGIKRSWNDADAIDDDPLLVEALEEYVRWKHADKFDKDESESARAAAAYGFAKQKLIHQCREETRVRDCEPSFARATPDSLTTLYYNDEQSASADCPSGTTGNSASATISAGTIASTISVSDANQKAKDEAQKQAQSRLDCQPETVLYWNDPQTATVLCQGSSDAPPPEGNPVTVTIPANTISSTVSKSDANQSALALAQSQAATQLVCTFWNAEQSVTLICGSNASITVTKTVAAHTYSSTDSQGNADAKAKTDAQNQAAAALALVCGTSPTVFWNTQQVAKYGPDTYYCPLPNTVVIICIVPAHTVSAPTQLLANQLAQTLGQNKAFSAWIKAEQQCRPSGTYQTSYP